MSPLYCDFTGEEIVAKNAKFGKGPELGSDYFGYLDKILSPEGKFEVELIVKATMDKQSVYKKETYDTVFKQVLEQYCNKRPKR
jgi:hypothetical protein